jgi:hypothetical protein
VTAVDPARGTATVLGLPSRVGGSALVGARPRSDGTGPDLVPVPACGSGPTVEPAWSGGTASGPEAWSASGGQRTDATGSVRVADADGWTPAGDGVTWRHDRVEAAVEVSDPPDDDGAALFARMTAPDPTDVGRPSVEHLPAEFDDAVLVARRQLVDGALSMRVDLVRHAPDLEVVVSARLPDPARADAAVVALAQLLAAVGVDDDRGRLVR